MEFCSFYEIKQIFENLLLAEPDHRLQEDIHIALPRTLKRSVGRSFADLKKTFDMMIS